MLGPAWRGFVKQEAKGHGQTALSVSHDVQARLVAPKMSASLGRQVIGNLTTVSASVRDFKTLILGFALLEELRARERRPYAAVNIEDAPPIDVVDAPPERTETSRGLSAPPKRLPVACSVRRRCW